MGKVSRRGTIAVLVMAGVLSFGQVSSAMAQSTSDAVEVHCAAEVTPLDEPTLPTDPVCFEYWLRWAPPLVRVSPTVQMRDSYRSAPPPAWLSPT